MHIDWTTKLLFNLLSLERGAGKGDFYFLGSTQWNLTIVKLSEFLAVSFVYIV